MTARWYAVMTKPRAEWGLHRDLRAEEYRTLWLHYAGTVRHARRVIGVLKPYLPRYLFVAIAPGQSLGPVNEHRLTSEIVGTSDGPLVIPTDVIEELASRGNVDGMIGTLGPDQRKLIEEGAEVRISAGAFEGLLATVELDEGTKVRVWVESFKRRVRTTLHPSAVQLVSPAGGLVPGDSASKSPKTPLRRGFSQVTRR